MCDFTFQIPLFCVDFFPKWVDVLLLTAPEGA